MEDRLIKHVFDIFEELPGHRGCPESVLCELEEEFGGPLPPTYRHVMLLDAVRMANITGMFHPSQLLNAKRDAEEVLAEDQCHFRLQPKHVVFAREDIYGFYFFDADGNDASPVYLFNYYDNTDGGLPRQFSPNVREHFSSVIRTYLQL